MPFPTITVKDGSNASQVVNTLPNAGQRTAAESLPVVLPASQIQSGSGAVTASTQRVTLATDGPGVANLSTIATNTAVQFGAGEVSATTQRVYNANAKIIDCSFTKTGSGLVADEVTQEGAVGSGMTVAQAYGNLLVDTGTTANSEFLFRSTNSIKGGHVARVKLTLSQKIVNQHFGVYLADIIGDGVPFTTDATGLLISVTLPTGHGFTSANLGQSCYLGGGQGAALIVPGRYAISAVAGDIITFSPAFACTWTRASTTATITFLGGNPIFSIGEAATVSASSDVAAIANGAVSLLTQGSGGTTTFATPNAGGTSGTLTLTMSAKAWSPNASGTMTVFGWNCVSLVKNGTSATLSWFDTQRKGWASGASSVITSTDASPGQLLQFSGDTTSEFLADATVATATALQFTSRASRLENLVDATIPLYVFIQVFNGVSVPASTTRLTVGKFSLEETGINKVIVAGNTQTGSGNAQRVVIDSGTTAVTVAATGIVVDGRTAHSTAAAGSPIRIGTKGFSTIDTTIVTGDSADAVSDISNGAITVKPYGVAALDINVVAPASGTITASTTPVTLHSAPAAGLRNYFTSVCLNSDALGAAAELVIRDAALTASSQTISTNILTTSTSHGLAVGDAVVASASTVTGLTAGVTYYVLTVPAATTLTFSATRGGSTLAISGTGVTATLNHIMWRTKLQTAGVLIPTVIPFPTPLRGGTAVANEVVTLTSTSTGTVYVSAYGYQGQ